MELDKYSTSPVLHFFARNEGDLDPRQIYLQILVEYEASVLETEYVKILLNEQLIKLEQGTERKVCKITEAGKKFLSGFAKQDEELFKFLLKTLKKLHQIGFQIEETSALPPVFSFNFLNRRFKFFIERTSFERLVRIVFPTDLGSERKEFRVLESQLLGDDFLFNLLLEQFEHLKNNLSADQSI